MVRPFILVIVLNDVRHGTAENRGGDSGRFEEKGGQQCHWGNGVPFSKLAVFSKRGTGTNAESFSILHLANPRLTESS